MTGETINHIGISGGKDSTALLLWAVHESGYPRESLDVTFSDTGNEYEGTYDYIRMLSEKVHPVAWLKPDLDFYELAQSKQRFPSPKARFCTQRLKMIPAQQHIIVHQGRGFDVLAHSGVRAEESDDRARLPEREWDAWLGCEVYRPLLRWTLDEVWAIHERYGIPRNPLYAMGAKRVGCFPCIMSSKEEVHNIARRFPERIERIREAEETMPNRHGFAGFFARDKVPERFRSRSIVTKDGEKMKVATIDDVVRWSETVKGGRSISFDPEEIFEEGPTGCNSIYGFCE